MSTLNREITNEAVIPVFESGIFIDNLSARFAVGKIAVGDQAVVGLDTEYAAYYDLRRNVYVDQTGQLDRSALAPDGTDRDEDDKRSIAFGVIENYGTHQRLVASMRLIHKGFTDQDGEIDNRPLPVETFCPDVFEDNPAQKDSLEVSRYIIRHEKAAMQRMLKWPLFSAALAHIVSNDLGPTYAVIEEWLERDFKAYMPMDRIGEPRFVPEYLDYNLPIEIYTNKLLAQIEEKNPGSVTSMQENNGDLVYFGQIPSQRTGDTAA